MTAIQQYFEETGDHAASLAGRIGVSPSTITRALRGLRSPSLDLAHKVEKATGGKVSAVEFMAACLAARPSAP